MKSKKFFLFISFILNSIFSYAQTDSSQIKMLSEFGSKNKEFTNLLMFQNIDYYNVKFTGKDLKSKYFTLLVKELWDGKIKKTDTLINSKTNTKMDVIGSDTLSLIVFGTKTDKNKLKLFFRFPTVGLTRKYEATNSDDYSLRDIGTEIKIEKNKYFPAFAYILPYMEDNWKNYCGVVNSGVNVENWGREFKIKHYLIFEMKFED